MKTAVIMQPTYLPWIGYFDLMDQADVFVFLDSVQFEKRSWQSRNRIKGPNGEMLLTIPVINKGKFDQKIADVEIQVTSGFPKDHVKAIEYNYRRAPFFKAYASGLTEILSGKTNLSELNIAVIQWARDILGIRAELVRSSEMGFSSAKADLLVNICEKVGAQIYLSPLASRDYIQDGKAFEERSIQLYYHKFEHPEYVQQFGAFIPFMSCVDLILNHGSESMGIIRRGRRPMIANADSLGSEVQG